MANKVKVWFDAEADFLEVRFSDAAGYEKETKYDAVMERVDQDGHAIGFSILGVSGFKKQNPLEADLAPAWVSDSSRRLGCVVAASFRLRRGYGGTGDRAVRATSPCGIRDEEGCWLVLNSGSCR
jgi:hypothetical protein